MRLWTEATERMEIPVSRKKYEAHDAKDDGGQEEERGSGDVRRDARVDRGGEAGGGCGGGGDEAGAGGEGEEGSRGGGGGGGDAGAEKGSDWPRAARTD